MVFYYATLCRIGYEGYRSAKARVMFIPARKRSNQDQRINPAMQHERHHFTRSRMAIMTQETDGWPDCDHIQKLPSDPRPDQHHGYLIASGLRRMNHSIGFNTIHGYKDQPVLSCHCSKSRVAPCVRSLQLPTGPSRPRLRIEALHEARLQTR